MSFASQTMAQSYLDHNGFFTVPIKVFEELRNTALGLSAELGRFDEQLDKATEEYQMAVDASLKSVETELKVSWQFMQSMVMCTC